MSCASFKSKILISAGEEPKTKHPWNKIQRGERERERDVSAKVGRPKVLNVLGCLISF